LAVDVADMRARMENEHRGDQLWEVKPLRGGLIDIEFIVQYLELRYAHETPRVLSTNSIEGLSRLCEDGPFDPEDADRLKEGLRLWTSLQAIMRLTIEGKFREEDASSGLRAKLAHAADCPDFSSLKAHMAATAERVHGIFRRLIDAPACAHRPYV
jgi:glutamate-ammonia-ligase adenylyltransferase